MQDSDNVILRRSWAVWLFLPIPFIVGDWLLWRDYRMGTLAHALVAQALVPVAVIGSIGTAIYLLKDLFERARGDHLKIGSEGVDDQLSKWRLGLVRWDEIASLQVMRRSAARIDMKIGENSPLRRKIANSNGVVPMYSLAMTKQQERAIRRFLGQAKQSGKQGLS